MHISSPQSSSASTTPVWIRWMPLWHGLFFLSLLLATGVTLVGESPAWQHPGILLGLSLGLGLWYVTSVVISPPAWQARPLLTMGYLIIGWTLWFALIDIDPVYLFVLTGLYPQVFILPPLPGKIMGACLLTAASVWRQVTVAGGISGDVFLTLAAAASGIIIAVFIHTIVEQSHQQRQLIAELEATRRALALAERQAGIMTERQRLAGEIHDTLAQGFTSIVMHLEAAEAMSPEEPGRRGRHLDQARRTARESLLEARRIVWALQPAALERASLAQALTQLAADWREEGGTKVCMTITGAAQPLPPEIEVTLLRAAQEALANVRKYAKASQVVLTLSYGDGIVILDVQDDGVGFDTACLYSPSGELPTGSFGLKALRERAQQLGGRLTVESTFGEGTTLAVALPALGKEFPATLAAAKRLE